MNLLLAQVFALLSSLCLLISFWQKKRKNILFFQMLDSLFDVFQYIFLGAYTASLISLLGSTRAYFFSKFNKKVFLYIFLLLYIISAIITFNGLITVIPLIAALIYTVVIWNKKEKYIRLYSILVFILWLTHDILVEAYVSSIVDLVIIISNSIAIYKIDLKEKKIK
ncbi:MAG: YgjV family protein [Clostridiales bacterium]|nr:YgjV family protein [Clostridiales bacterium]